MTVPPMTLRTAAVVAMALLAAACTAEQVHNSLRSMCQSTARCTYTDAEGDRATRPERR